MRGETGLWRPNQPLADWQLAKLQLINLPLSQLATGPLATDQLISGQLATNLANLPLASWPLANLPTDVGQVVNLRPIVNRPTARPAKLFRRSRQPCRHRIHLNVLTNPLKLGLVTNQPIIALILPEQPPGQSKHLIALTSRESLERLHHLANLNQGRHQEMNVIRHHDVGVELIMPQLPKVDGIDYHARDFRDTEEMRASACVVEDAVHSEEGLPGGGCSRETAVRWKTAVQAPRDEDGLADGMIVRKTAASKGSHLETVADLGKILRKVKRPIANRPQVTNLPHKAASRQAGNAASSKAASRQCSQQAMQPAGNAASSNAASRQSSQQGKAASRRSSHQWSLQVNAA